VPNFIKTHQQTHHVPHILSDTTSLSYTNYSNTYQTLNMDINQNNPKKFLQIQITNFEKKLFTILYLDEFTRTIHHTEPSDNTLLSNLNNFPIEWAFSQENKPLTDDINPKILPNPTTNIEVIHINFNFKKHSNSNNNNNIIQITSRLLSSRNAHKVFTVTNNYIKKFPPIPSELQNQLNSYILFFNKKNNNTKTYKDINNNIKTSHFKNQSQNNQSNHIIQINLPIQSTLTILPQTLHNQLTLQIRSTKHLVNHYTINLPFPTNNQYPPTN